MDFMCHLTRNDDATSSAFPYTSRLLFSVLDSFILKPEELFSENDEREKRKNDENLY